MKNNLICIVGPTGVGKTRLAVELNRKLSGSDASLISVDSRQIYIGMDIGTGKDAKIFGTDLTRPDKLFSVAEYVRIVKPYIEKLWREAKLPILVGGTGLYLKALIDGIETIDVPPNENLRKKYANSSVQELQKILVSMYPYMNNKIERAGINNSDWNNPRRLIRKIEIEDYCSSVGEGQTTLSTSCLRRDSGRVKNPPLQINKLLIIGLTAPIYTIKQNIEKRVQDRLDKGLLEEIKGLIQGYGWNIVLRNTIAYKEWEDYLFGKITKEQAITNWTKDEFDYVKRQLTWFRKDRRVVWLNKNYLKGALELINSSYLFGLTQI